MFPTVESLNYRHLLYFWTVAREGSVVRAARRLLVSQPTISAQIKELEQSLGERLFSRAGRGLALTEAGQSVLRHADDIFASGRRLIESLRQHPEDQPLRLSAGITDGLPKLVARMLLEPALNLGRPVHLLCREGRVENLLPDLASYRLDVVLSDLPVGPGTGIRTFTHLLGESTVAFYAVPALWAKLRRKFPASLSGAPLLLPTQDAALRRSLEHWFSTRGVQPVVVGEFEDSALLKTFAQTGMAAFPAPSVVETEICRQYGVRRVGVADSVKERFYAITPERKLKHPAVVALSESARQGFLG